MGPCKKWGQAPFPRQAPFSTIRKAVFTRGGASEMGPGPIFQKSSLSPFFVLFCSLYCLQTMLSSWIIKKKKK